MKKQIAMLLAAGVAFAAWTGLAETVTNVRGAQREKSDLVDIYYDLVAEEGGSYTVEVQVEGRTNEVNASTFTGDVGEGVAPGRNRHILWNAGADWPGRKGDVKAVITATKRDGKRGKVQLWAGGPYWADRNIGASAPEDYGLYFWWGDTTGHRPSGTTFSFSFSYVNSAIYTYGKSVSELQSAGWVTSDGILVPSHDAAHVKWGGSWRMPTKQELVNLNNKCDWTWTTMNGVNGYIVRGRGAYASNSIFLPAAGHGVRTSLYDAGSSGNYQSSVPYTNYDADLWGLYFYFYSNFSSGHETVNSIRHGGQSIRPVQGFTN